MKWAILSDIHGNLPALEAVIHHMKSQQIGKVIFTGDLVGHGPSSELCVQKLHELIGGEAWVRTCVKGNNDKALLMNTWMNFEGDSRVSLEWAKDEISKESLKWLGQMSERPIILESLLTVIHGTVMDSVGEFPYSYMYDNDFNIVESFLLLQTPICVFGHIHRPVIYSAIPKPPPYIFKFDRIIPNVLHVTRNLDEIEQVEYEYNLEITQGKKFLVCAGSIGQPRDGDRRASYLIIDDEKKIFQFVRLPYDIEKTVEDLKKLGAKYPQQEKIFVRTEERIRYGR